MSNRTNHKQRVFTKSELLDYIKDELCHKSVDCIGIQSIERIADILCIDLSDAMVIADKPL